MKRLVVVFMFLFLVSNAYGQDSNPDGVIGNPVITLLGGLGTGSGKFTASQTKHLLSTRQHGGFNAFDFSVKIEWPTSKSSTIIFMVKRSQQKTKYPEMFGYVGQDTEFVIYGLSLGIKLFAK